jgi:hypothetical protein
MSLNIKVSCRLRPLNQREKRNTSVVPVVLANTAENSVTIVKGLGAKAIQHRFHVDNVFGSFAEQHELFEKSVKPLVCETLKGFESTVFAYGQTGTGKTYTMEGDISSEQHMGVIPRSVRHIFKTLSESRFVSSTVSCQYLEIYNEELSDLLVERSCAKPLRVCTSSRESGGSVVVMNLSTKIVHSVEEVIDILNLAREKRQIGETKMNLQSSRSHCLFTLQVDSTETVDGGVMERRGKLHLVDLAGSECAKTTGNKTGSTRMRESQNINKSLLTLGRCISTLRKGGGRVPYRDSKLTRLLQEALGGRCKTLIIATLSPSILSIEESLSTLTYAEQAHGIVNKKIEARARMQLSSSSSSLSGSSKSYGNDANRDSKQHESRTFVEMEARLRYYESQCENAQNALAKKHSQVTAAESRADAAESKVVMQQEQIASIGEKLDGSRKVVLTLQEKTNVMALELKKTVAVVAKRREVEIKLTEEANQLLVTLSDMETRTKRDRTVLSRMQQHDQSLRMQAQKTSKNVQAMSSTISDAVAHHVAQITASTELIDEVTLETKTSMLALARSIGLAGNEHVAATQKMAEQLQANIFADSSVLANVQCTLTDTIENTGKDVSADTLPELRIQVQQHLSEQESAAALSSANLSNWVHQCISDSTARSETQEKETAEYEVKLNGQQKTQQEGFKNAGEILTGSIQHILHLVSALETHEETLLSHRMHLKETAEHLSNGCNTTLEQLENTQNRLVELCHLTSTETSNSLEHHTKSLNSTLLTDIVESRLSGCLTVLSEKQTSGLESMLLSTNENTRTSHESLSSKISSLKDNVWVPHYKDHEEKTKVLDKEVLATLQSGRRGNLFQSHSISVRSLSNSTLESLEGQRERLTTGCIDVLMSTTKKTNESYKNVSQLSFETCNALKTRSKEELEDARRCAATTMNTLEHIVEVNTAQRQTARKQHNSTVSAMANNISTATASQRSIATAKEGLFSTLLKEQKEAKDVMVSSILETVQKMLSESTQKMSDDLEARVQDLRAKSATSIDMATSIDAAMSKGEIAFQDTNDLWESTNLTMETTVRETVCEELHTLHENLEEMEDHINTDVANLASMVVERNLIDEDTLRAMNSVFKVAEMEVQQESKNLSTLVSESAEGLLEESEQWNTSVSNTHKNLEGIHQQVGNMSDTFFSTFKKSDNLLSQATCQIETWKEQNDGTSKMIQEEIVTSGELSSGLVETSRVLNNHVNTLLDETSMIKDLLSDATARIESLSSSNTTTTKHIETVKTMVSKELFDSIKTTSETLTGVTKMQTSTKILQTDTAEVNKLVANSSHCSASNHTERLQKMQERRNEEKKTHRELMKSTSSFVESYANDLLVSSQVHRESIETAVGAAIDSTMLSLGKQRKAVSLAKSASSETRRRLEERTRDSVSQNISVQHKNLLQLVSAHTENIDVCMTAMENQASTTASSIRVATTDHATEINQSSVEMQGQHVSVLCESHINMHKKQTPLEQEAVFVYSKLLSSTPDVEEITKNIILENEEKVNMKVDETNETELAETDELEEVHEILSVVVTTNSIEKQTEEKTICMETKERERNCEEKNTKKKVRQPRAPLSSLKNKTAIPCAPSAKKSRLPVPRSRVSTK